MAFKVYVYVLVIPCTTASSIIEHFKKKMSSNIIIPAIGKQTATVNKLRFLKLHNNELITRLSFCMVWAIMLAVGHLLSMK